MATKLCNCCKRRRPLSSFWKDSNKSDGHCTTCKECKGKSSRTYVTGKGRQKALEAGRRYAKTEAGRTKHAATQRKQRAIYPERHRARAAVQYEIHCNRLKRATECICHYCPAKAEEYHHHNGYDEGHKIDVVPVCRRCHKLHA